jgi:hypothetical protein
MKITIVSFAFFLWVIPGVVKGQEVPSHDLVEMVRKYQPKITLNNQLQTCEGSSSKQFIINTLGDFETPEQDIPDLPLVDKLW